MSTAASPQAASISANLRWFGVVYALALLAAEGLVIGAAQLGFDIPATGPSIGAYVGVVFVAGQRFAQKRNFAWQSRDRHNLAMGYVFVAALISCLLFAAVTMLDPNIGAQLVDVARASPQMAVGALLFAIAFHYGIARLMLRSVANRGEKK